jgi:adenylate cyclase
VRRGLLFLDDGRQEVQFSFALRVALRALSAEDVGAHPDPDEPNWIQIGPSTLRPLEAHDGGYAGQDAAGYQFLIDYASAQRGFDTFSLSDLLAGRVAEERIRRRVVVVGSNAQSLPDFFPTPGRGRIPGMELHGHLIDQLLRLGLGETRPLMVWGEAAEVGLILAVTLLACLAGVAVRGSPLLGIPMLLCIAVAGPACLWAFGTLIFERGFWVPVAAPALAWFGGIGLVTAWVSARDRADRSMLMRLFSRHVSAEIAAHVWSEREQFFENGRPRPRRLEATVLFIDMRGYTEQSEKLAPDRLMLWSNQFIECMARLVEEHGGVVDDYFGDGIKANFGVPVPRQSAEAVAEDARRAVRSALAMARALPALNATYAECGLPPVAMKVGIDSGWVVAGELGSAERLKYTSVGGVPVTAQRLESTLAVPQDFEHEPWRILISGRTAELVVGEFDLKAVGAIDLKGKSEPVAVFRVGQPASATPGPT